MRQYGVQKGRVQCFALQAGQSVAGNSDAVDLSSCRAGPHATARPPALHSGSRHEHGCVAPLGTWQPVLRCQTHCAASSCSSASSDPNVFSPLYLMYRNPSLSFISSYTADMSEAAQWRSKGGGEVPANSACAHHIKHVHGAAARTRACMRLPAALCTHAHLMVAACCR